MIEVPGFTIDIGKVTMFVSMYAIGAVISAATGIAMGTAAGRKPTGVPVFLSAVAIWPLSLPCALIGWLGDGLRGK